MDRLFSTYVTPQIKEIYHPEIIQEWKLNIDAAEYEIFWPNQIYPLIERKLTAKMITTTGLCQ